MRKQLALRLLERECPSIRRCPSLLWQGLKDLDILVFKDSADSIGTTGSDLRVLNVGKPNYRSWPASLNEGSAVIILDWWQLSSVVIPYIIRVG
jgi:hypothetical protein